MRNLFVLVLVMFATFVAWIVATALLISPFMHVGDSFTVHFGLVTLPDVASLLLYSVIAFGAAWLASRFVVGSTAGTFRLLVVVALVVLFLWIRGAFILSNYRFSFFVREFFFALVIVAIALFAFRLSRRQTATSNHTSEVVRQGFG